ncbi:MAG: hypothetical protein CM1200mP36_06130 [Gammaproteobacteria bacterium]|nr:MAG: hypothetical protein CM1200mP36_06130 [Gammaproteobacteria bacterium]
MRRGPNRRLQPEAERREVVDVELVQNIFAKMARIPPKPFRHPIGSVSHLERDLKLVILGQDRAIGALTSAIKMSRSGSETSAPQWVRSFFPGPTGWVKLRYRQLALAMGVDSFASTCPSTWKDILCRG